MAVKTAPAPAPDPDDERAHGEEMLKQLKEAFEEGDRQRVEQTEALRRQALGRGKPHERG